MRIIINSLLVIGFCFFSAVTYSEPAKPVDPHSGSTELPGNNPGLHPFDSLENIDIEKLIRLSQDLTLELELKKDTLNELDKSRIYRSLGFIQQVLATKEVKPLFRFSQENDILSVMKADGTLLFKWNNHDKMEAKYNYLALLDSTKEFRAVRSDGKIIIRKWNDVTNYWLTPHYIGLLDKSGVFEAYRTEGELPLKDPASPSSSPKPLIADWADTKTVIPAENFITLLDTKGILEGYNLDGTKILRAENVSEVVRTGPMSIRYTVNSGQTRDFIFTK